MDIYLKKQNLQNYIKSLDRVAVAFSGGVDSTYLLKLCSELLGDNAVAITSSSNAFTKRELDFTRDFCNKNNIRHVVFDSNELIADAFMKNQKDRCYHCKKAMFTRICEIANSYGINNILEGANLDDEGDYRPGRLAVREMGVISPLCDFKLTKNEIRQLSYEMGLSNWDKPSFACLASRFEYGEPITAQRLEMVDKAEKYLYEAGFSQFRVRVHGAIARVEIEKDDFKRLLDISEALDAYLKKLGFTYVTMDLAGYHTGSMNKLIK